MIFYNSLLAKWFLGKGKKHYFMLGWFFFTRYKYLEVWEDMELRIHAKQYWECFSLTLIPALILSLLFSWWCMILPFITYDLLYWFEKIIYHHSIFNWEAIKHSGEEVVSKRWHNLFYILQFCYIFFWLCCFFLMHLATSCYIPIISGYK